MVFVMAQAFDAAAGESLDIEFAVTPRSLAIAYALGVLLTLAVVAVSAWRVSTMTISAAIRNLPEPPSRKRRRRLVLAARRARARRAADALRHRPATPPRRRCSASP